MVKRARKDLIMTLAKALIAAAWSDGEISLDERNCLKDFLFNLRELSARDWASLEIYMAAPLQDEEQIQILAALRAAIRSPADKRLALEALRKMIETIGPNKGNHEQAVDEILQAIQQTSVNPVSQLSKSLRVPLSQRSKSPDLCSSREAELEQFMRNRIAFHFRRHVKMEPLPEYSDDDIQLWSAAGGLLARVAHADSQVTDEERSAMAAALGVHWNLPPHVNIALIDIALDEITKGLDFYRLSRQYYQKTSREERQRFVTSLFKIALADGELSHEEIEEIRHIARGLKLSHRQMIQAKLEATGE